MARLYILFLITVVVLSERYCVKSDVAPNKSQRL